MNTNKAKHTPGPWIVSSDGKAVRSSADIMANYRRNVVNAGKRDDVEEMAANLALCAAAPELLAALERVLECHRLKISLDTNAGAVEQARAAIAKAKGDK